jgi:hypothetical protein
MPSGPKNQDEERKALALDCGIGHLALMQSDGMALPSAPIDLGEFDLRAGIHEFGV